jgi:hypothetical protein
MRNLLLGKFRFLLGKFSSPPNAQVILDLAKFNLSQGDERFLNDDEVRAVSYAR